MSRLESQKSRVHSKMLGLVLFLCDHYLCVLCWESWEGGGGWWWAKHCKFAIAYSSSIDHDKSQRTWSGARVVLYCLATQITSYVEGTCLLSCKLKEGTPPALSSSSCSFLLSIAFRLHRCVRLASLSLNGLPYITCCADPQFQQQLISYKTN